MASRNLTIIAVAIAALVCSATPAQALHTSTTARILTVRLTENGPVRVTFDYRCPSNAAFPVRGTSGVYQFRPVHGPALTDHLARNDRFGREIVCDGTLRTIVSRHQPPEGNRFMTRWPLHVSLNILGDDYYSDGTFYGKTASFDLVSTHLAGVALEMDIRRVRVLDSGRLKGTVVYVCPAESHGIDQLFFYAFQDPSDFRDGHPTHIRGVRECDGTAHRLRVSFAASADWNRTHRLQFGGEMNVWAQEAPPEGYRGYYTGRESLFTLPTA